MLLSGRFPVELEGAGSALLAGGVYLATTVGALEEVRQRPPPGFEQRYGYRPWLVETHVRRQHKGICHRSSKRRYVA